MTCAGLATRTTMGVITGDVFVDGRARDSSFQRKTGYCQQQGRPIHISILPRAQSSD